MTARLTAAADGSCLGNPGPGGWACATSEGAWMAGGEGLTTNNRMEIAAIAALLSAVPAGVPLLIETDSRYAIDSLTTWLPARLRNGWLTAAGRPVANLEAIAAAARLLDGRDVEWRYVKGHAGHVLNEVCDLRARAAATATRGGSPVDAGPGLDIPAPHTSRP